MTKLEDLKKKYIGKKAHTFSQDNSKNQFTNEVTIKDVRSRLGTIDVLVEIGEGVSVWKKLSNVRVK